MQAIYQITPKQKVVDLGCGTGKLINILKRQDVDVTGVELNPLLYLICKLRFINSPNVHIYKGDLLEFDLKPYDVLITYAVPGVVEKLQERILMGEAKNPLVLISNRFMFNKLNLSKQIGATYLYLYP